MTETSPWHSFQRQLSQATPIAAIILGSGLGSIAQRVEVHDSISYSLIPMIPAPSVEGHGGQLLLGQWADQPVLVFSGRVHYYEGHSWDEVLGPIHLIAEWKIKTLIMTNAAGGIRDDLTPGHLMAITAHYDLTKSCSWHPQFDNRIAEPYCNQLLEKLAISSQQQGIALQQGTYASMPGPNYETPAEIRALKSMGVAAVGMSTAREIEVAHQRGIKCMAVSCITNRAAGLDHSPLSHQDVIHQAELQADRLGDLLAGVLRSLA